MPSSPPANAFSDEEISVAQRIFSRPCDFMKSVADEGGLPHPDLPEIAFAGRSNVGKSSSLNAILSRKSLAQTSNTPGRTRFLNFFEIENIVRLVDLPGYGYAAAPKNLIAGWTQLFHDYLLGRANFASPMFIN